MRDDKYWDTCNDQSIRQKVAEFIDNSPLLSKFKGEKYYELEDAIVALIEQNKGSIHATVEKENKVYDELLSEENAKYIDGEAGICPTCGCEDLEYGKVAETDDGMAYPWKCPHCGAIGEETYSIEFFGHYTKEGKKQ